MIQDSNYISVYQFLNKKILRRSLTTGLAIKGEGEGVQLGPFIGTPNVANFFYF